MVLKDVLVVVAQGFGMLHCNQERIIYTGMGHITAEASKEACHYVQVREVSHELARLREVMVVTCYLDDTRNIVVRILLVGR